jgi:hypothetical protein
VVDGDFFPLSGREVSGYFDAAANRIVLSAAAQLDGAVVRHEMLHAINRRPGHPRSDFLEACAGLVTCSEQCITDAGPPPPVPVGAVVVPLQEMAVSLEVTPTVLSRQRDDGFFAATILVRNDRAVPVLVLTPVPWGGPASRGFGYSLTTEIRSQWLDEFMRDSSLVRFAPGEVKRWQVDIRAADFSDDELQVAGHYLRRFTEVVRVRIVP